MEGINEQFLDTYYILRPGYFFVFPRRHQMQIRNQHFGSSLVSISGTEQEVWIENCFGKLNGKMKLREILTEVPPEKHEQFLLIVLSLCRDFLTAVKQTIETNYEKSSLPIYVNRSSAEYYDKEIRHAKVLLIGAGMLGSRIASQLAHYDLAGLTILDRKLVDTKDQKNSPAYVFASNGQPRACELEKFLVKMTEIRKVSGVHKQVYTPELLTKMMEAHTLTVLVEDDFDPSLYYDLNNAALKTNRPWTMAVIDGLDSYIGPTFIPNHTGCYECFNSSKDFQLKNVESYYQYEEYLRIHNLKAELFITPGMADSVAGLLASDIPNVLGMMPQRIETEASLTLGRQLHMNFRTYDAEFFSIVKRPRCRSCGL